MLCNGTTYLYLTARRELARYSRCPRPMAAPVSPWSCDLDVVHSYSISPVNYAKYVFKFVKNI